MRDRRVNPNPNTDWECWSYGERFVRALEVAMKVTASVMHALAVSEPVRCAVGGCGWTALPLTSKAGDDIRETLRQGIKGDHTGQPEVYIKGERKVITRGGKKGL